MTHKRFTGWTADKDREDYTLFSSQLAFFTSVIQSDCQEECNGNSDWSGPQEKCNHYLCVSLADRLLNSNSTVWSRVKWRKAWLNRPNEASVRSTQAAHTQLLTCLFWNMTAYYPIQITWTDVLLFCNSSTSIFTASNVFPLYYSSHYELREPLWEAIKRKEKRMSK